MSEAQVDAQYARELEEYKGHVELLSAEKNVLNQTLSESINSNIQQKTAVAILQSRIALKEQELTRLNVENFALKVELEALKPKSGDPKEDAEKEDNGAVQDDLGADEAA